MRVMFSEIIETKEEAEEFLYHYTTMETLLFYILPQKTLKFSEIRKTNDPEEIYGRGYSMKDDLEILKDPQEKEKWKDKFFINQKKFSDALQKEARILCCSQDRIPAPLEAMKGIGRGFLKPRMWAQYADNHKGICLVLDREKMVKRFNDKFKSLYHVSDEISYVINENRMEKQINAYSIYTSELKGKDIEEVVENRIKTYADIYYFTKHPDWRDENEYRFLVKNNSKEDLYIDIDGILQYIIMGTNSDDLLKETIEILTEKFLKVPELMKLLYFNGYFNLCPSKEF